MKPTSTGVQQRLLLRRDLGSPSQRDLAILRVLLDPGLRDSESCRMRVTNLDRASGDVQEREGNDTGDHAVVLGQRARSTADRYLPSGHPVPDDPDPDACRVFPTREHRPFMLYALVRMLKRPAARTDPAHVHPHRFHHASGATYLQAG